MKEAILVGNRKWTPVVTASVILLGALALVVPFLTPGMQASNGDEPGVFDRGSVPYGRTYGEWSAAWEQWADSIPTANHPLFDHGDCSVAQSGPVWFLGGKFCANNDTTCGTSNVVRSCRVPSGKALYFAVLNSEDSTLEDSGNPQIAGLRAFTASMIDGATDLRLEVDGQSVPNLKDKFRTQSPAFVFTIPKDNFFTAVGEGPFDAGSYFPTVDDGVFVMLAPLPLGHHTIHFHGSLPAFNFTLYITYHVYVYR